MYHDYFSVEHFMRDHQQELLAAAGRARRAREALRGARAPWAAGHRAARRPARGPMIPARLLAGFGRALVTVGRSLERLAAAGTRSQAAGFCEEQPTAAGC